MSDIQAERTERRRSRLLTGVLSALVVAVCIQGAYLWHMQGKLEKAVASTKSEDDGWTVVPNPNAPKDTPSKAEPALPGIGSFPDPFAQGFGATNWDPFQEMEKMRQQMNQFFNQSMGQVKDNSRPGALTPSSTLAPISNGDLTDEGDKYVVKIDMPGADKSTIKVEIKDQVLTVTGKRDQTIAQQKDGRVMRQEHITGQFQRSVPLPEPVNEAGMKTSYEKGTFTVTLPKQAPDKPGERIRL